VGRALAAHDPALWGRAAQVWACLGLLHHDTEEPWLGSTRRRLLIELADGGGDRITEAALFALVTYAWVEPSARSDVAVITRRLTRTTAHDPYEISWSVAQLAQATPGLDRATGALAAAVIRAEENYAVPLPPRSRRHGRRILRALRSPFSR
jgi:hypothetical protein